MAGITDQFKGIPMDELIGAPLAASCKAQYSLATNMVVFINEIGFEGEGDKRKTKTLDFDLERPVDNGSGVLSKETVSVKAPLLGLVPIPALLIESVTINFTMEVKQSTSARTSSSAEASSTVKAGGGWWSAEVTGKVATQRENTRSTDNTAKYEVTVIARQQQPQEGMAKLMDLMASATEPLTAAVTGPST